MLIGYARVSKADGSQKLDLQRDALIATGVQERDIYTDTVSGAMSERLGLDACLRALREGDTLVIHAIDRLGRDLNHLTEIVGSFKTRGVGLRVLSGMGADLDTSTAAGEFMFNVIAAVAQHERTRLSERTHAGLAAARARGRVGGRKHALKKSQVRRAQAAMGRVETDVSELAAELGVSRSTLYRYVSPEGELRKRGKDVLGKP